MCARAHRKVSCSSFRSVSWFRLCFRVQFVLCKYLSRIICVGFGFRCQQGFAVRFVSCVLAFRARGVACKYLQGWFCHFRFRKAFVFVPASTCSVQLWLSVWFSGSDVWLSAFVFSRPKFARKSPTNCRTRRCTRPPTAPFVPHFASGGG